MAVWASSKEKVWEEFAREIGAEFVKGGFRRHDEVVAFVKRWIVTLDTWGSSSPQGGSQTWTRMRAPYVSKGGLRFEVVHKGWFARLWRKFFGAKDIEVGYPEFEHGFIIKANDESRVRALLRNPKIRQLIQAQPGIRFKAQDILGSGLVAAGAEDIDWLSKRLSSKARMPGESWAQVRDSDPMRVLVAEVGGDIKDVNRLKSLFELFAETLNHLCGIGSASAEGPIARDLSALVQLAKEEPKVVERITGGRMAHTLKRLDTLGKEDPQAAERIMEEIDSGRATMADLSTLVARAREGALTVEKAEERLRAEGRLPPREPPPTQEA